MPKVKANELTDASVAFISLVDRGANREPFRIKKYSGDEKMIDLSNGLKGLFQKTEARKPVVAFVAFSKGYDPKAALALVEKAELKPTEEGQETDDALVIPTLDGLTDDKGIVIFKLNDDVAVGVRFDEPETIKKGFSGYDYESTDFKSVLGTNTTMPMIGVTLSALQDTIWNAMANSESVDVAKKDVVKAFKDCGTVVAEIMDRVPATAFKLEAVASKAVTAKAEDQGQASGTKNDDADKSDDKAEVKKGDEPKTEDKSEDKTEEKPADDKGGETEDKTETKKTEGGDGEPSIADVLSAVKAMKTDVDASFASVNENVKAQGVAIKAVKDDLEKTQKTIAKMDDELGTNVIGGEAEGEKTGVSKSDDDDGNEGFISLDTAFGDPFEDEKAAA